MPDNMRITTRMRDATLIASGAAAGTFAALLVSWLATIS